MGDEENFPRGGRRIVPVKRSLKSNDNASGNLFSIQKHPKSKKPRKEKKKKLEEGLTEDVFQSQLKIQGTLSYSKIQDGMIILGCIRHITSFALEVELPGLTFATIGVTNISDPFTKYLNAKLEENYEESDAVLKNIFKAGQFLPVKILKVETKEKGVHTSTHVVGSINPRDIYSDKNHMSFKKGLLAWGSIQSVLDHGYEMSFGITNCRVFLPLKNIENGKKYAVGEPLWCTIHKCDSQVAATTLRVSAKDQHIFQKKIEDINGLLDVIPGMEFEFVTEKITSYGIQGKFLQNYFGYIDESHLKQPLQKVTAYKEGELLMAYVLYIEPTTKITHLTLRKPSEIYIPKLNVKDLVTGEVFGKTRNGILLKLPNNEKGFISNNRLLKSLPEVDDIMTAISSKYPDGSRHTCRILDYNHLQQMFVCTVEQKLIKGNVLTSKDLTVGQLVKVTIEQIKNDGIVVTFDDVRGFVPNLYISSIEYSENIKKKFLVGSKVKARVLKIDEANVLFTLKQGLIESKNCLSKIEEAVVGNICTGVVVQTKPEGALIAFYGKLRGWLSSYKLPKGDDSEPLDPTKYFFRGQVITAWISKIKEDMVSLTLIEPKHFKSIAKIGERIVGVVQNVTRNEIIVTSEDKKYRGNIPINHLSVSLELCGPIKTTLKVGDKIAKLICVNNEPSLIFSRREAIVLKNSKLRKFESLRNGSIIRCWYDSDCPSGIYVVPFIVHYHGKVLIQNKDVIRKNEKLPKFQPYQCLLAKVCEINNTTKVLKLSIKVDEKKVETIVEYFSDYLSDIEYLRQYGLENNWEICRYSPGERVLCKIEKVAKEGGCLVSLPNGAKGLVAPSLCPGDVKEGQDLEGVFLSQDFRDNYVEVCLKKDISQKINNVQSGKINTEKVSSCYAEKILVKREFIIAVSKQESYNKQLIYLPIYLNPNDFTGCLSQYNDKLFKVCICGKVGSNLIGLRKKLFMKLDKARSVIDLEKKKRQKQIIEKQSHGTTEEIEVDSGFEIEDNSDEKVSDTDGTDENKGHNEDLTKNENNEESDEDKNIVEVQLENETQSEETDDGVEEKIKMAPLNNIQKPILPGVSLFFNPTNGNTKEDSSSDDEEQEHTITKKKKLTPAERAEVFRQEEERILKIENELSDLNKTPESAAQFDRLVLVHPDSSKIWINYISFHIAATEIDKARAVAKRALETINMIKNEEKFKVWVVLLNLENMFGTKELFEKVLEEALKFNDSLQIYIHVIRILAEAGKYSEMEEKVKRAKAKHKQEANMWLEVGKIYYQINNFKEARNMKDGALKCITDKKTQLSLIVRFAIMEFKYGEEDQGAAIFETILSSDPRKVMIWTTYVDQLVKKNKIDQARIVLERAVVQRLPVKSMRALFLKFRKFEEEHGTSKSLEAVKKRAFEYVSKVAK